jgi:hypothetical protein
MTLPLDVVPSPSDALAAGRADATDAHGRLFT